MTKNTYYVTILIMINEQRGIKMKKLIGLLVLALSTNVVAETTGEQIMRNMQDYISSDAIRRAHERGRLAEEAKQRAIEAEQYRQAPNYIYVPQTYYAPVRAPQNYYVPSPRSQGYTYESVSPRYRSYIDSQVNPMRCQYEGSQMVCY